MNGNLRQIQKEINDYKNNNNSVGELSDGYHTFDELYKHRTLLFALAIMHLPYAWKSKLHYKNEDPMYKGMFVVGCPTPSGMISYHTEMEYWNLFKIPEIPYAPKFDGYTPNDVLDRIERYILFSGAHLVDSDNLSKIEEIVNNEILPVFEGKSESIVEYLNFYLH